MKYRFDEPSATASVSRFEIVLFSVETSPSTYALFAASPADVGLARPVIEFEPITMLPVIVAPANCGAADVATSWPIEITPAAYVTPVPPEKCA